MTPERLFWYTEEIWGVCRGLGWTLDSERACKLIGSVLEKAIAEGAANEKRQAKMLRDQATQIQGLKRELTQLRKLVQTMRHEQEKSHASA